MRLLPSRRRLVGFFLVSTVVLAAMLVAGVVATGHAADAALELVSVTDPQPGSADRMTVNGLRFDVRTGFEAGTWVEATERLAAPCGGPVIRRVGDRAAVIACLVDVPPDPATWMSRLSMFSENLDISAFGTLRIALARRVDGGATHVLVQSAGRLPLGQAFPLRGDAPGQDLVDLPRIPGWVRAVSAHSGDGATGIAVYRCAVRSPGGLQRDYRRVLARIGWAFSSDPVSSDRLVALRNGRAAVVTFVEDGLNAIVTIVAL